MMSAREIADIWEEIVDAFKDTYEIQKFAFQRQIGENMENEIKIDLVPKEQINEDFDCVRITCENICVWANCLESAIKAFDEALRQHRRN